MGLKDVLKLQILFVSVQILPFIKAKLLKDICLRAMKLKLLLTWSGGWTSPATIRPPTLQAALRQVLGEHIQQRGSLVAPERLRFDFSHLAAMTVDEIKAVQRIVNERIRQNLKVSDEQMAYKKAVAAGAIALFDEKYGDMVRVMRIGEPAVSAELCGGTHISFTGEIGYFQIISEGSIGAGLRRIEAVTGRQAGAFLDQRLSSLDNIARSLETTPDNIRDKVVLLVDELEKGRKQVLALERELARQEAGDLLGRVEAINGVKVLAARVAANDVTVLREMADFLRDKLGSAVVVLGAVIGDRPIFIATVTPDLVKRGYNAGDIIKQVSRVAGAAAVVKRTSPRRVAKIKTSWMKPCAW